MVSAGGGSYSSPSLDDWYRDSACRGGYGGDSGNWSTSLNTISRAPYTCHKSSGSSSIRTELDPFWDELTSLEKLGDRPTTGWEGVLNSRGIDRAFWREGTESCETAGNMGYEQIGISNQNYCKWIDIRTYGTKSSRSKRQFWYDEMNKD